MAISNAVGVDMLSRVLGYKIDKGDFSTANSNLPQRISILAEANTANQAGLSLVPIQITTLSQAATLYGYGSPMYNIMRILKPANGGGTTVPIIAYPQAETGVAASRDVTPVGTATANARHTVVINGREGLGGETYDFNIVTGDTVAVITSKIRDAVNAVLGAPVIASNTSTKATLLSKWAGLTSEGINVTINTNDAPAGMTYAVTSLVVGSGTPSVQPALDLFGSNWNTIVVNSYGSAVMSVLEAFNGIPDPTTPTGRYNALIIKPFISLMGETSKLKADYTALTTGRTTQVTNAICPAPGSKGLRMEAAANMAVLFANQTSENPHLDVAAKFYPDMPIPTDGDIGDMSVYDNRNFLSKNGSSTVDFVADNYKVMDFITTYRLAGENPPQFKYCRNIVVDLNVFFGYHLLEELYVIDHAIAADEDIVSASKVIKPKMWNGILRAYSDDLVNRGLTTDAKFMKDSIAVGLSVSNPDRLETAFNYKRSGFARVASTTAKAGFNFGE
jgi:phage tail sheath gpL-like